MYIPRDHFSTAYNRLKRRCSTAVPSVLILTSLDIDSICACRMLTRLLKSDFIPHKLHPVAGYQDLARVNQELVVDNEDLVFLILLGVGGLIDIAEFLALRRGIECWVIESRRPWHLQNVFAGAAGEGYAKVGSTGEVDEEGGVVCWDDGDVKEFLGKEEEAFKALVDMPEVESDDDDYDSDSENEGRNGLLRVPDSGRSDDEEHSEEHRGSNGLKRRTPSDGLSDEYDSDDHGRRRRKRINSGSSSPEIDYSNRLLSMAKPSLEVAPPSPRTLRKRFLALRRKHTLALTNYYNHGSTYGEPISSLVYSLASELGREDNDLLWLALVGWEGQYIYGRSMHSFSGTQNVYGSGRSVGVWGVLRDEVRRLNPPPLTSINTSFNTISSNASLHTTALSPTDTSLRLSSEFRFLLIRHWSLYDSMLHSAYLGAKLHIWSEHERKRLHKLLATMGFSLAQCKQNYTHMDMDLKKGLRDKLDKYAGRYGLDEIVREGVVRCWGWKACLSAGDVSVLVGGILELGKDAKKKPRKPNPDSTPAGLPKQNGDNDTEGKEMENAEGQEWISNFHEAYDALEDIDSLLKSLPTAIELHRAILAVGTALIEKRQIKHLRAFRMAVVKEGPDLATFTHPSALTKLALWISEAIREQERELGKKQPGGGGLPLVVAALNEWRGVYIVVGTGTGANVASKIKKPKPVKEKKEKPMKKKKTSQKDRTAILRSTIGHDTQHVDFEDQLAEDNDNNDDDDDDEDETEEEDSDSDSDSDDDADSTHLGRNRFGIAFQEVANETAARVRIDSFEACVVEVRKEDLSGFLESLSLKTVVG